MLAWTRLDILICVSKERRLVGCDAGGTWGACALSPVMEGPDAIYSGSGGAQMDEVWDTYRDSGKLYCRFRSRADICGI